MSGMRYGKPGILEDDGVVRRREPEAGHPGFLAEVEKIKALHCKKAADYGTDTDPFANIRASVEVGITASKGAYLRLKDKIKRLDRFFQGSALVNESAEDSLQDLSNYALICLVMLKEEKARAAKNFPADYAEMKQRLGEVDTDPPPQTVSGVWPPPQGGRL